MLQQEECMEAGNIIVVDDTPDNLRLLGSILRKQDYKVRLIPNGELALSAVELSPPDLILLDIMMPGLNGYQVCSRLKENEKYRDIPILFISAIDDVIDKVKAFEAGGVDYITKPFQVKEVLARVETHLKIHSLQQSLQHKNKELYLTIQTLQETQDQLVQSEKMAALGQLVAGIAHEINTPLGAIRSSIENIMVFLTQNLEQLPEFLHNLSPDRQQDLFTLSQHSLKYKPPFSSKEKRKYRRVLNRQLESYQIENADTIADTLVDLGVTEDVSSFLSLLKDEEGENILNTAYQISSVQRSAQTIKMATDRAAKVVFALKTYARYDHSGEKIEANIIEGIETILTLYHNQLKHGVEVMRNYADSLPPILCYPDELNQVWTNLIHNAIQAMENQGILTIEAFQKDNSFIVRMIDTGLGISPEVQPRIFEPFFTTKPAGQGSGLGLDIVKKIIEKHQGHIQVDSVPGQTMFTVYLPMES